MIVHSLAPPLWSEGGEGGRQKVAHIERCVALRSPGRPERDTGALSWVPALPLTVASDESPPPLSGCQSPIMRCLKVPRY